MGLRSPQTRSAQGAQRKSAGTPCCHCWLRAPPLTTIASWRAAAPRSSPRDTRLGRTGARERGRWCALGSGVAAPAGAVVRTRRLRGVPTLDEQRGPECRSRSTVGRGCASLCIPCGTGPPTRPFSARALPPLPRWHSVTLPCAPRRTASGHEREIEVHSPAPRVLGRLRSSSKSWGHRRAPRATPCPLCEEAEPLPPPGEVGYGERRSLRRAVEKMSSGPAGSVVSSRWRKAAAPIIAALSVQSAGEGMKSGSWARSAS